MTATLLPPNATPLERSIEAATARVGEVPAPIRETWDPATCPAAVLPWLAWAEDVPVWRRDWDERMKRGIIAASWRLHRQQGTLAGLKALAGWTGAQILRAVTPPGTRFAGKSLTKEERNAFVARYPQLRIFRYRTLGHRVGAMLRRDFAGHAYPVLTDAALRLAPRAYLWRDGAETPLVVLERTEVTTERQAVTTSEVHEHGHASLATFCGQCPQWLLPGTARARIYTLRLGVPYLDSATVFRRTEVSPSMDPIDVHHDQVAEQGHAAGMFTRGFASGMLRASSARDRLYDRIYLFDETVSTVLRRAATFLTGHLGMTPHHAVLMVALRGRRGRKVASGFVAGHPSASSHEALDATRRALAWGKRLSDKVLMDTVTRRPLVAGAHVMAGSATAGASVTA